MRKDRLAVNISVMIAAAEVAEEFTASTCVKLQSALEKAGIKFLAQDDTGGIGVRLKR